jgi:hypothetical protein
MELKREYRNKMFNNIIKDYQSDANVSDIISKLKFIGRIQKGEKVNVRYMYVQQDSWITRLSRTFFSTDNRMNTCHFVENTIKRSFDIINLNKESNKISDKCLVRNIIEDIKNALIGINNIKDTYMLDIMFCCKLDTLIQETNSKLLEFDNLSISNNNMNDVD